MRQLIWRLLHPGKVKLESLTETDEGWELPLRGVTVTAAVVAEHSTFIDLGESNVVFEGPIEIATAGRSATFDPEDPASREFAPFDSLAGQTVELACVTLAGELILEFSEGSRLSAKPIPHYESWQAEFDGSLLVCGPSGSMFAATPKPDQKLIKMKTLAHRTAASD